MRFGTNSTHASGGGNNSPHGLHSGLPPWGYGSAFGDVCLTIRRCCPHAVAPPAEMHFIDERLGSAVKRQVTLERSGHVVSNDVERERVLAAVREFMLIHALAN